MIDMKIDKGHIDMFVDGAAHTLASEATVAFNALLDTVKTFGEETETKFKYLVCQIMTGEMKLNPDAEV